MAEETNDEAKSEKPKGFSPLIKMLLITTVLLVIPASLGLVTYKFVISPLISEKDDGPEVDPGVRIPDNAVPFDFIDLQASLQTTASDDSELLLMYNVTLMCDSPETFELVQARKSYFDAKIDELHRGRTKADIGDKIVIENIEMQIMIEANKILKRINPEGDNMILEVMHWKLTVIPL